jgi:hypothetical protein
MEIRIYGDGGGKIPMVENGDENQGRPKNKATQAMTLDPQKKIILCPL